MLPKFGWAANLIRRRASNKNSDRGVYPLLRADPHLIFVRCSHYGEYDMKSYPKLRDMLDQVGKEAEAARKQSRQRIRTTQDLEVASPLEGVYWIETNMPIAEIVSAVKETTRKGLRVRCTKPEGIGFTRPDANEFQVIYIGTQNNIRKRLSEHLFNTGSPKTGKLRCQINHERFSRYEWYFSQCEINHYSIRYAVESWWRLNIGWPPFCIR